MTTTTQIPETHTDVDRMLVQLGAGRLTVTVESIAHAKHVTFRLKQGRTPNVMFLDLSDVEAEWGWTSVATVRRDSDGSVSMGPVRPAADSPIVRKAARILLHALFVGPVDGYAIHAATRCGRCGRRLTTPESVENGIGPECAGKTDAPRTRAAR